eukprot:3122152-Rhodomonas_salina.1
MELNSHHVDVGRLRCAGATLTDCFCVDHAPSGPCELPPFQAKVIRGYSWQDSVSMQQLACKHEWEVSAARGLTSKTSMSETRRPSCPKLVCSVSGLLPCSPFRPWALRAGEILAGWHRHLCLPGVQ